jgi:hypothetical protein
MSAKRSVGVKRPISSGVNSSMASSLRKSLSRLNLTFAGGARTPSSRDPTFSRRLQSSSNAYTGDGRESSITLISNCAGPTNHSRFARDTRGKILVRKPQDNVMLW